MQCEVNKMEHEVNNFQKIFLLLKRETNLSDWEGENKKGILPHITYLTMLYSK